MSICKKTSTIRQNHSDSATDYGFCYIHVMKALREVRSFSCFWGYFFLKMYLNSFRLRFSLTRKTLGWNNSNSTYVTCWIDLQPQLLKGFHAQSVSSTFKKCLKSSSSDNDSAENIDRFQVKKAVFFVVNKWQIIDHSVEEWLLKSLTRFSIL